MLQNPVQKQFLSGPYFMVSICEDGNTFLAFRGKDTGICKQPEINKEITGPME